MSKELEKIKPKTSQELINNITSEKQRKFLELYPKFKMITRTAAAMGKDRRTVHGWLVQDDAFSDAFRTLKKELETELIEAHEQNIHEIAFDKAVPPQSRLLGSFFTLKGLVPDKYRDQVRPSVQIGEIKVLSIIPRPEYLEGEYEEIEPSAT